MKLYRREKIKYFKLFFFILPLHSITLHRQTTYDLQNLLNIGVFRLYTLDPMKYKCMFCWKERINAKENKI